MMKAIRILAALAAAVAVSCAAWGCGPAAVNVTDASPRMVGAEVSSGSNLDEASQYAQVSIGFDQPLEATGDVLSGLEVTLNGEAPDSRTIKVSAEVEGSQLTVRLTPTEEAANGGSGTSVYFALYDGDVTVASKRDDGGLAGVCAQGGQDNAVLSEAVTAKVPSGMTVTDVQVEDGGVSFAIGEFARLRCCSFFSFGEGLPVVMMHNHEFARDIARTAAERLAATINANYGDALQAQVAGEVVTVRAAAPGQPAPTTVQLVEGVQ